MEGGTTSGAARDVCAQGDPSVPQSKRATGRSRQEAEHLGNLADTTLSARGSGPRHRGQGRWDFLSGRHCLELWEDGDSGKQTDFGLIRVLSPLQPFLPEPG